MLDNGEEHPSVIIINAWRARIAEVPCTSHKTYARIQMHASDESSGK